MAVKGPEPLPYTLVAGADLSGAQFAPIAINANGQAIVSNGGGTAFIGVLENKPKLGEHATVQLGPCVTKVRVGLAVTPGNYLTIQSGGWFIPGQAATFNNSVWANAGSKTAIAGIAFDTVASGGVATAKIFQALTFVNSN
jgi:hypothetical protein